MDFIKVKDLFPTKGSAVIFVLYMVLFINQGLLVTASQSNKSYNYNTISAVFLTEVLKLVFSIAFFIHRQSTTEFFSQLVDNRKAFLLYLIPSSLYCLYNNLAYTNLVIFDPTTYFLLLQLRVVVTGVVFQVLFSRQLTRHQWMSLLCLTVGCMIKEFHSQLSLTLNSGLFLILLQVVASSTAGVYNEYLLKSTTVPILIQNCYLYISSIILNGVLLANSESRSLNLTQNNYVLWVIVNNAAIGIVTSFFLSKLNSIVKTFASALELVFTAVLCYLIFGIHIGWNGVLSVVVVVFSVFLYSFEPVNNSKQKEAQETETEQV